MDEVGRILFISKFSRVVRSCYVRRTVLRDVQEVSMVAMTAWYFRRRRRRANGRRERERPPALRDCDESCTIPSFPAEAVRAEFTGFTPFNGKFCRLKLLICIVAFLVAPKDILAPDTALC